MFCEYDITAYPLDQGRVLIEAAAGSGKTYTIQFIFLRLLLERDDLRPAGILVVTFTEAATEELKDRIRDILRQASRRLGNIALGAAVGEDDLGRVLNRALARPGLNLPRLRERLHGVLAAFDELVITTIHGFCNRILNDYAFECGRRGGLELVRENRSFLKQVAEDYWRRTFYEGRPVLAQTVVAQGLTTEDLYALGALLDQDPELAFLPEQPEHASWAEDLQAYGTVLEKLERVYTSACRQGLARLQTERDAIERALFADQALKKNLWRPENFAEYAEALAELLAAADWLDENGLALLERFTNAGLERRLKQKRLRPEHPFFDWAQELYAVVQDYHVTAAALLVAVKRDFIAYASGPAGLEACKRRAHQQGYSDFLTGLRQALTGAAGRVLRRLTGERFKVALVDEFQDTDPVQNTIFNALFRQPGLLYYRIGDPKQSIYGFRGADIFSYLEAARENDQRRATLDCNYRSTPELLQALNYLFQGPSPFLLDGIDYRPMRSGGPARLQLFIDSEPAAPLTFWHLPGEDSRPLSSYEAGSRISGAVADRCVELLRLAREENRSGWRAELVETESGRRRPLRASDIAVLTSTNREAKQLWELCLARGLPALVTATGDLWRSREARDLFLFLRAVLAPDNDRYLATALGTCLLGLSGARLAAFHETPEGGGSSAAEPWRAEYEAWRGAFFQGRETWRKHGLPALLSTFPDFTGVEPRPETAREFPLHLARGRKGERALTNFLHLREVLHETERENLFSPAALLLWFERRLEEGTDGEKKESELKLESEADAIRIMTVHKSKGLEFPVVFATFLWSRGFSPGNGKNLRGSFHQPRPEGGFRRCLDLSARSDPMIGEVVAAEELAEQLRLFYVAVTRAVTALYLAWPQTRNSGKTALMYLRRPPRNEAERREFLLNGAAAASSELINDERSRRWETAPGIVGAIPQEQGLCLTAETFGRPEVFRARNFTRPLLPAAGILSFSRLTGAERQSFSAASRPAPPAAGAAPECSAASPLAAFPGGTATGNAVHEIFEKIDFSLFAAAGKQPEGTPRTIIRRALERFGLGEGDAAAPAADGGSRRERLLLKLLELVLQTRLPGPDGAFRLADPALERVREMEFWLPLAAFPPAEKLTALFKSSGLPAFSHLPREQLERWRFSFAGSQPERGFLNGYIDLVFSYRGRYYLLDWKTNNLGPSWGDYRAAALQQNILEEDYLLQYHLYLIALHRFLAAHLVDYDYDRHCGGVYYLYLRGINGNDAATGVFYDRPSRFLVETLAQMVCGDPVGP